MARRAPAASAPCPRRPSPRRRACARRSGPRGAGTSSRAPSGGPGWPSALIAGGLAQCASSDGRRERERRARAARRGSRPRPRLVAVGRGRGSQSTLRTLDRGGDGAHAVFAAHRAPPRDLALDAVVEVVEEPVPGVARAVGVAARRRASGYRRASRDRLGWHRAEELGSPEQPLVPRPRRPSTSRARAGRRQQVQGMHGRIHCRRRAAARWPPGIARRGGRGASPRPLAYLELSRLCDQ